MRYVHVSQSLFLPWNVARVFLLLLIPVGYWATYGYFDLHARGFFLLNMETFAALSLLLYALKRVTAANVVIVVILTVFTFGYLLTFYLVSYQLGNGQYQLIQVFLGHFVGKVVMLDMVYEVFVVATTAMLVFCLVATALLVVFPGPRSFPSSILVAPHLAVASRRTLLITVVLAVLSTFLRAYFHLSSLGEATALPFRLGGIIYVTNAYVTPALFGLSLFYALHSGCAKTSRLSLILFVVWAAIVFLMFTAKIVFLTPAVWMFLILVLGFRMKLANRILTISIVLFLLLVPVIGIYRNLLTLYGGEMDIAIMPQLVRHIEDIVAAQGWWTTINNGFLAVISRISGFSSTMLLMHLRPEGGGVVSYLMSGTTAGDVMTAYMHKMIRLGATGVGASLIGQAYYATGTLWGTALWVAAWTTTAFLVSRWLLVNRTPVNLALWAFWVFTVGTWSIAGLVLGHWTFLFPPALVVIVVHWLVAGRHPGRWSAQQSSQSIHNTGCDAKGSVSFQPE